MKRSKFSDEQILVIVKAVADRKHEDGPCDRSVASNRGFPSHERTGCAPAAPGDPAVNNDPSSRHVGCRAKSALAMAPLPTVTCFASAT